MSEFYSKVYIAVLEEVDDFMVPTLVAHSMLGAHLEFSGDSVYDSWLENSFRKVVLRVNEKEFEKIKTLPNFKVYLGHENTQLEARKSCAVVSPVFSNEVPNVLKYAKLWKPQSIPK